MQRTARSQRSNTIDVAGFVAATIVGVGILTGIAFWAVALGVACVAGPLLFALKVG